MKTHGPPIIVRFSILIVVILIGIAAAFFWWQDGISPVDKNDTEKRSFVIPRGETINAIAARLSAERFIRSKTVFYLYIKQNNLDNKIQAGNFKLSRSMDLPEVANQLTIGTADVWVTTLEGWRNEEIASKLAQEMGISEKDFLAVAEEGYMFPDTYLLPKDASGGAVAAILRQTFDKKLTAEMRQEIERQGRSIADVVILASILEREGRSDTDRPVIAGILLKRIKTGMSIDVDATLQYALGYQVSERTWWKKALTNQDKLVDSFYNTYKHVGLPPAPISNPGISSLKAAMYPQESPYWYYLHDPEGQIHYAKTLSEHEDNIEKFLQ